MKRTGRDKRGQGTDRQTEQESQREKERERERQACGQTGRSDGRALLELKKKPTTTNTRATGHGRWGDNCVITPTSKDVINKSHVKQGKIGLSRV